MSAGAKLARALVASARSAGCRVRIVSAREYPWASATYVGARHDVVVDAAPGPALATWLAALPEAEFALPGHIVADVAVERVGAETHLAVLTLVDA